MLLENLSINVYGGQIRTSIFLREFLDTNSLRELICFTARLDNNLKSPAFIGIGIFALLLINL